MKDAYWVFKSFGFKAGILFVVGATTMGIKRLLGRAKKPKRFEELSDEEAKQVAWAFGIYRWQDRQDLNEQFGNNDERVLH
jgi:vancomycin permeability regulator SanA